MNQVYLLNGKLNLPYLLKNASILFHAGEYRLARNIYRAIFLTGEVQATMLYRLGRCFEAEGKWEQARESYEQAVKY